jgi:hypothetical protein
MRFNQMSWRHKIFDRAPIDLVFSMNWNAEHRLGAGASLYPHTPRRCSALRSISGAAPPWPISWQRSVQSSRRFCPVWRNSRPGSAETTGRCCLSGSSVPSGRDSGLISQLSSAVVGPEKYSKNLLRGGLLLLHCRPAFRRGVGRVSKTINRQLFFLWLDKEYAFA